VLLFAHAGHWISSLLILLPTVAFIIWLVAITRRDRRREREKQIER
jgi:cyanate permease